VREVIAVVSRVRRPNLKIKLPNLRIDLAFESAYYGIERTSQESTKSNPFGRPRLDLVGTHWVLLFGGECLFLGLRSLSHRMDPRVQWSQNLTEFAGRKVSCFHNSQLSCQPSRNIICTLLTMRANCVELLQCAVLRACTHPSTFIQHQ